MSPMFSLPVPLPVTLYLLIGLLLAAPLAMWAVRLSPAQAGWRLQGWRTPALGVGWGIILAAGLLAWLKYLMLTGDYLPIPTVVRPHDWAILALAAPVAEEIFLRGVLFGSLQRNWSLLWAVVLSATADVVLHYSQPWIAMHFVVAAGYALSFRQANSIFTPIIAHALAVGGLLLARMAPGSVQELPWALLLLAGAAGLAFIAAGSIRRRVVSRD